MAGKQVAGDGLPANLAGMSKTQLYDIMFQMKTLIEQNKQQARQILIQNPALTRALFQAQIILGMVQSPVAAPTILSTTSQIPQPSSIPNQQSNSQTSSFPSQNQTRKQQPNQTMTSSNPPVQSKPISPPHAQTHPMPAHHLQSSDRHLGTRATPSQIPGLTQLPQQTVSQPLVHHHQPPMPSLSTPLQQPMQNIGGQYLPLQPPLPSQPRPQMQAFPHQVQGQMGQNLGFQHHGGPQMQPSQQMFNSSTRPPAGMGPSFPQGQLPPPNQILPPSMYQIGGPHIGMEFNQAGSSKQPDRVSNWMPGPPENTISTQFQGPPPFAGQMGPSSQSPQPAPLNSDMEKALLHQVMSLTQEQINMLPAEQRNQVLQLQQMLRQ